MLLNKRISPPRTMDLFDGMARLEHTEGKLELVAGRDRQAIAKGQRVRAVVDEVEFVVDASEVNWALAAPLLFDRKLLASNGASLLMHAAMASALLSFQTPLASQETPLPPPIARPVAAEAPNIPIASAQGAQGPKSSSRDPATWSPLDLGFKREASKLRGPAANGSAGSTLPIGPLGVAARPWPEDAGREMALADAANFGMIGLVADQNHGLTSAPWGPELGEAGSQSPAMWLDTEKPIGLSTAGSGGGGKVGGIGLGRVRTLSHCSDCKNEPLARSFGFGVRRGEHRTKPPVVRWGGGAHVVGRLPPETVQRVIRQNFGRYRACYEAGLVAQPTLAGRVTVSFVIGRDGSVSSAVASAEGVGGNMSDCVARGFYGLSFPAPAGGTVNVVYPLVFSPE